MTMLSRDRAWLCLSGWVSLVYVVNKSRDPAGGGQREITFPTPPNLEERPAPEPLEIVMSGRAGTLQHPPIVYFEHDRWSSCTVLKRDKRTAPEDDGLSPPRGRGLDSKGGI